MAPIDWTFLAVLLVSMLIGAWRGLVYELLSLAAWVVAFFAAQWGAAEMADWLPLAQWQDSVRYAVGFAVVFVLVMFACSLLAWLVKKGIEAAGLRPADRSLGAVFGVLRGVLLLLAQVQVGMRQRHQELVVYRTLGAGKRLLRMTLWSEFALLGLVAGLVAAIGAEKALAVLQPKVFDFPWEPDWRLWLTLPLCGAGLLSLCGGWLGTRLLKGKALFRQFAS